MHGTICHEHNHNNYNQNQVIEYQRQTQEEKNNTQSSGSIRQQIYHKLEETGQIIGVTNNYKFYESKNIKNKEASNNSITVHYTREGVDISNLFNENKAFYQSNNIHNNYMEAYLQKGFCPIHGDTTRLVQVVQKPQ